MSNPPVPSGLTRATYAAMLEENLFLWGGRRNIGRSSQYQKPFEPLKRLPVKRKRYSSVVRTERLVTETTSTLVWLRICSCGYRTPRSTNPSVVYDYIRDHNHKHHLQAIV